MQRTVMITGGTGAVGGAVIRRSLRDGHNVVATWRVEARARALEGTAEDPSRLLLVRADATDPDAVEAAVAAGEDRFGPVGALVHLVGGWRGGEEVHEHSLRTWDDMLALNLRTAFLWCRAVLPGMRDAGWGRIVLMSARTARRGRRGQAAYAVAKAGVAVLAETIAEETRGTDVTANVVALSTLDTPANRAALPSADPSGWVSPEDAAAAIAFLTSEEAGRLRGAWLSLYGSA